MPRTLQRKSGHESMPYAATIFNVMIASPGDVAIERGLARDIVNEWNAIHGESRKMALMPIGWETHSHPSLDDRAQGVLNKQILERADLLVAIFWTRIGTPTGEAVSGSVEEIQKHVKSGKPAMIYFSNAPVRLDSVDECQFNALKEFKAELKARGLYVDYDTPSNFADLFRRHLPTKLNSDESFRLAPTNTPQEPGVIDTVLSIAKSTLPMLSKEAKILLTEASLDRNGIIMHASYLGGVTIQSNGKQFMTDKFPRSRALWEGALKDLANLNLAQDKTGKGEVYTLTREGYDVAEQLRP
jgi:hypothetical protein